MPRVSCSKCSRVLEYGGDRPSFCAYCGQSLGSPTPEEVSDARLGETTAPPARSARGDETVDYTARPGNRAEFPDQVKGYKLLRQLGRGGMGTVFEAEDTRHDRKVAIKIIAAGYVDSAGAVERFRQEGRLASSLTHPRCVFVLEADEDDDGRPFIAMELMTGQTLQDLVEQGGPLAVGDAVSKILDVVEGLAEAHRLGLIHRDVKPSNCFLDADGRVKVGDFGLSKSQVGPSHLTRTGSFLGTPLYASPEQIKVEPLDGRTDVYSTSATLYFLLTGRAPFDRGDASATMARIVTDPAPSARSIRPEVPRGLDRAIRRGLERDRDRRHRDLDEFRAALLPYQPGQAPRARTGIRVGVYLFDYLITFGLLWLILEPIAAPATQFVADFFFMLAYFSTWDGLLGGSPGKRLMRLRVTRRDGLEPAGLLASTLRALVFLALAEIPIGLLEFWDVAWPGRPGLWVVFCVLLEALGLSVLAWPMLARGDGRALHDRVAGTRVVALPGSGRRLGGGGRRAIGRDRGSSIRPVGVLQAIGPYKVRGAVRWEPSRRVVSGEDSTLGREAWIVIRPKGSPAPSPARREASRPTRPRWLDGGEQAEGRWDAYVAPNGCPLADLAGPEGLPWRDARSILEDLADELAASCFDGTLPPGRLTVDQVWVQPDGRAILVDPLSIDEGTDPAAQPKPAEPDHERGLSLLRRSAALAMEGGRCRADAVPDSIRATIPVHASALLGRLIGGPDACQTVDAFRDGLESTRMLPTEATPGHRAMHLAFLGLALTLGLAAMFALVEWVLAGEFDPKAVGGLDPDPALVARERLQWSALVFCAPAIWAIWDVITRGGFSLRFASLALVRPDGRRAPRWRCGFRTLLTWLPVALLLFASVRVAIAQPKPSWVARVPYYAAAVLLPAFAALALAFPCNGPHDRLSGLRVVPR